MLPRAPARPAAQSLTIEAQAIVRAVAYTDVFDYPLTSSEILRFLPGVVMREAELLRLIHEVLLPGRLLACRDGMFMLPGREHLVDTRHRRAGIAARVWPKALAYGRRMARLPFVAMVGVTGALAFDNTEADSDIDFLIVTEPGRLWLCRSLIIATVVRGAADDCQLCPNYLISASALSLPDRSLYAAYELTQMRLVSGIETYGRLVEANGWIQEQLPNWTPAVAQPAPDCNRGLAWSALSVVLRTPAGAWFENWEMSRKIRRFTQEAGDSSEATFSADCCKGHFSAHRARTLAAWKARLDQLGLEAE